MKLDIRIVAIVALATIIKEKGKVVVSYDDIIRYKNLLENKFKTKFNLGYYNNDIIDHLFQHKIDCRIDGNVYFSLKSNTHPSKFANLVNSRLLLNKEDSQKFASEYDDTDLTKKQINDKYLKTRLKGKNSIDNFLGQPPFPNIFFEDFMAIYILQYSKFCGNIIDNNKFFEDIQKIGEYLNTKNVTLVNPDKFNLFVFLRRNSKYVKMNNKNIFINKNNIESYYENTVKNIRPEFYNYISKLLEIYMINGPLNTDLSLKNKKGIA